MTSILPLEGVAAGAVWAGIFCTVLGLLALRAGWLAYTEPTPHFVTTYTGWTCPPLAMFHGGVAMLILGVFAPFAETDYLETALPKVILGIIGITWVFCGITFLLGFFFWFPPFLLPLWYHRARRAGIDRHDLHAMGAFKALPTDKQKAAVHNGRRR